MKVGYSIRRSKAGRFAKSLRIETLEYKDEPNTKLDGTPAKVEEEGIPFAEPEPQCGDDYCELDNEEE